LLKAENVEDQAGATSAPCGFEKSNTHRDFDFEGIAYWEIDAGSMKSSLISGNLLGEFDESPIWKIVESELRAQTDDETKAILSLSQPAVMIP